MSILNIIYLHILDTISNVFKNYATSHCLVLQYVSLKLFFFRGYYVVVVPLKKQRTGKFLKPWDSPDEMNLEEVNSSRLSDYIGSVYHMKNRHLSHFCVITADFVTQAAHLKAHATY